jgi:hypothetical protein
MAFNGSGVFVRVHNWVQDLANTIKITASRMDAEFDGIATALSNCLTLDGQSTVTADLPMATQKLTGLSAGSSAGDSVRYEQVVLLAGGTMTGPIVFDTDVGLTASVTQNLAGALALTAQYNVVGTVANTSDAVGLLPAAKGTIQIIHNAGANALAIWPNNGSSDTLDSGSVDAVAASNLAAGETRTYVSDGSTNWVTLAIEATDFSTALLLAGGTMTGPIIYDTDVGLTASVTQNLAGALALTAEINIVDTVANGSDAVGLPAAAKGKRVTILNNAAANSLAIWPNNGSSDSIDDGSVDAVSATELDAGDQRTFICEDGTNWFTLTNAAGATNIHMEVLLRDVSIADSTQSITGLSFAPVGAIVFFHIATAGVSGAGMDAGGTDFGRFTRGDLATTFDYGDKIVSARIDGSNLSQGTLALTSDGCDLVFVKSGSPTGALKVAIMLFG